MVIPTVVKDIQNCGLDSEAGLLKYLREEVVIMN
jgi:hypothetical protein